MKFDSLARNTPAAIRQRASKVQVSHLGTDEVDPLGQADLFAVTSGKGNYLAWVFIDERGDCKVSCACGSFVYFLETVLASKGASVVLYSNGAPPVEKNPLQRAYLCKHLYKIWLGRAKYKIEYHPPEPEFEEEPEEEMEEEPEDGGVL